MKIKIEPARQNFNLPPDIIGHLFQYASTKDLHKLQRVSKECKRQAMEVLQRRSGLLYRKIDDKSDFLEVRILYDIHKRIAIEVRCKAFITPTLLPIKDKESYKDKGTYIDYDIYHFGNNRLQIGAIIVTNDPKSSVPLRMVFFDRKVLFFCFSPCIEYSGVTPTSEQQALIDAVNENDTKRVDALLATGVSANTFDKEGAPLLVRAASYGDITNLILLLKHGAHIEACWNHLVSPHNALLMAVFNIGLNEPNHENKHKDIMRLLIERGARIDVQSQTGKTLLHYLARKPEDNTSEIQCLLDRGLNPAQVDLYDRRPVDYEFHNEKNVELLYRTTMNFDPPTYISHCACEENIYTLYFKPGVWMTQKTNAFEAIANKLKSFQTKDPKGVGLASDTKMRTLFPDHRGHSADVTVPPCADYAAQLLAYDSVKNALILTFHEDFKTNSYVHQAMKELLSELSLALQIMDAPEPKSSFGCARP